MTVDWDLVVVFIMVATFLVGLYFYARNIEPGCSGNCQQGRLPCDCNLNKKDQV
jgi:hypothetical protein